MNTVLKSLLTPLLCLCLVGGLLSGCTSSNSSQDTSTEYLSEQTQTESFPVRLELTEESHIIQSKPRRLAVLSADLIQASVKSERGKIIHHLYKYTVCAVVTTILTYWTWNWLVWVTQTNPVSTAYRFPLIWAYSSLLVLFGFSAIFFFRHVGIGILRMVRLHRQHRSGGGQPSEAK